MSEDKMAGADIARAISELEAELFVPFPANPPAPQEALERVYAAFAGYGPSSPFCRQCFTPEQEQRILSGRDLHAKVPGEFRAIYFEHPDCSVGAGGFMYFLPRMLETLFFPELEYEFFRTTVMCGLYATSQAEQAALRDIFTIAANGWFRGADISILMPVMDGERIYPAPCRMASDDMCETIVDALLHLRVHPREMFSWLAQSNTAAAWTLLCRAMQDPQLLLEDPVYFAVDKEYEPAFHAMAQALRKLAWSDLFVIITPDVLARAWESIGMRNQRLYDRFHDADAVRSGYQTQLPDEERLEALRAIEALVHQDIAL